MNTQGRSATYPPLPRALIAGLPPAEQLAQTLHSAYEALCYTEFGYTPRPWLALTDSDQRMRIAAAQEVIDREVAMVLPDCPHDQTVLVRTEVRQCQRCGSYPLLLRRLSGR